MLWHETDCAIIALPFFVARQVQEQLFPNCFVARLSCMATVRQSPLFRTIVFLPRFFYLVRPPAFSSAMYHVILLHLEFLHPLSTWDGQMDLNIV